MTPRPDAKARLNVNDRAPPSLAAVKEAYERGMARLEADRAEHDRIKAEFFATPVCTNLEELTPLQRRMMSGGV